MTGTARGTFEVKLAPLPAYDDSEGSPLGRLSIDKTFSGDLAATSKGEMLSAMGTMRGSAGYVAIERVEGTLAGRVGSFVLQHSGTMNRGEPGLAVAVVPDTGSGGLTGLKGTMTIEVAPGSHFYALEYELPDAEHG